MCDNLRAERRRVAIRSLITLQIDSICFTARLGVIKLRDLLSFSPIDVLVKTADQKSYHAILQELKDKEIYNMIIDIHDTENMSDFLKAVSEEIDLLPSQRARRRKLENINLFFQFISFLPLDWIDSRAADEWLQISLFVHVLRLGDMDGDRGLPI